MVNKGPSRDEDAPTVDFCAYFSELQESGPSSATRFSLCPTVPCPDGKDTGMKLRVRVEDQIQTIELDDQDTDNLWVSFFLEGGELSQEERETLIQEAFDEHFNKPDYNNWHKHNRHLGRTRAQTYEEGENGEDGSTVWCEPLMEEVLDDRVFRRDEIERDERESYEAICQWVRGALVKKPNWADAFIADRMDGMSVNDYAALIGLKDASIVSKWLARAEKKLAAKYPERQI